jgi:hypothetical protein
MDGMDLAVNSGTPDAGSPPANYDAPVGVDEITSYLGTSGFFAEPAAEMPAVPAAPETVAAPTAVETPAPETPASVGGTDTAEQRSAHIPRSRFDEVNTRLKDATTRLSELEAIAGYQTVISRFSQAGFSPEQILAALEAPAPAPQAAPAPEVPTAPAALDFDAWCEARNVDRFDPDMPAAAYAALEASFESHQQAIQARQQAEEIQRAIQARMDETTQKLTTWEQQREAERQAIDTARQEAERQAQASAWAAELEVVKGKFTAFADTELQQDLIRAWSDDASGRPMEFHAQALLDRYQRVYRNQLSAEAVHQSAAAQQRPVVAGGASPSPAVQFDPAALSNLDVERATKSYLEATGRHA